MNEICSSRNLSITLHNKLMNVTEIMQNLVISQDQSYLGTIFAFPSYSLKSSKVFVACDPLQSV